MATNREVNIVQHIRSVPLHIVEHDGRRSRTIWPFNPHRHIVATEVK